jgi:hypothetical protein
MSRIDIAEFVEELIEAVPDLPEALKDDFKRVAVEPEGGRVAALRRILEQPYEQAPRTGEEPSGA